MVVGVVEQTGVQRQGVRLNGLQYQAPIVAVVVDRFDLFLVCIAKVQSMCLVVQR